MPPPLLAVATCRSRRRLCLALPLLALPAWAALGAVGLPPLSAAEDSCRLCLALGLCFALSVACLLLRLRSSHAFRQLISLWSSLHSVPCTASHFSLFSCLVRSASWVLYCFDCVVLLLRCRAFFHPRAGPWGGQSVGPYRYYAMLAKTGVHHFSGDYNELGTACGCYYRISCLSITDPGDSDIIRSLPGNE